MNFQFLMNIAHSTFSPKVRKNLKIILGKSKVQEYHYPVQYKMNEPKSVRAAATAAGFSGIDFAFSEEENGPINYFPGPLRPIYHLSRIKRAVYKQPKCLINMFGRLTKA